MGYHGLHSEKYCGILYYFCDIPWPADFDSYIESMLTVNRFELFKPSLYMHVTMVGFHSAEYTVYRQIFQGDVN